MSTQLLDINPRELKFKFELKKQSSCAIQLVNICDQYVAFKVKTTSPKKYCVRPNTGIIEPKSKYDFTVTLQAQRSAPSDLPCKDKFLIQSTVVPLGTTEEDITSGMFVKDGGKHIEETKLRVVLISPPHSPVLLPVNGVMKQEPFYETPIQKDKMLSGMENLHPVLAKDVEDVKSARKDVEPRLVKDVDDTKLKLGKDIEELKSKLNLMESKLTEADLKITRLTAERSTNIQERETLKQELGTLRGKRDEETVRVGFPFLFVCSVALISLSVGYLLGL